MLRLLLFRISAPIIIIILGILSFKNGVTVLYRPEITEQGAGILIFHIISFFTFGAKDYGPPTGGPEFWQYVLYFVYYAAPVICLSALAEALYMLSKPFLPLLLYRKKHYLIIGYGRVGKAAASLIKEKEKRYRIVVIDKNEHESPGGINLFRWKTLFLARDMNHPKSLDHLNFNNCKGVFIVMDEEWLNLKLYYEIKEKLKNTDVKIFTNITSVELLNFLNKESSITDHIQKTAKPIHLFFNIHIAASQQLFDHQTVNRHVQNEYSLFQRWKKDNIETIIFFGFGRFGSSFLKEFKNDFCKNRELRIILIDPVIDQAWKYFQIDYPNLIQTPPLLIQAGMENLTVLEEELEKLSLGKTIAVFCSDSDVNNLRYATAFHRIYDKTDETRYILRTNTRNNFPDSVLQKFLGENHILIPTYDWIKAYFEDYF